ncbi:ATP-binding protein [Enterococcus columbae]|uniref:histidine kinase n=1 Tax=Enterococcus columbae DSM 7374 = ATCC 51263 TaxID=1121865 RepID=S1NK02_9ENTE|nr:ATP-binding protein [Enterococcus columbae]EOT41964.1 hypothetical protein OMW_01078 [Enterococcus columbae DSM 7374 = ATCC 51263]EOW80521.1 hypothetical protein I568_01698 [Enterococcus columbae DSM 7374 = ATCC 51263]
MKKIKEHEFILWAIGLLALYLLSWQVISYFYNQQVTLQQANYLKQQAQTLIRIADGQKEQLIALSDDYVQSANERITLIDAKNGKIIYDTFNEQLINDLRTTRPEVKAIMDGNTTAQAIRYSQTLKKELIYVTVPIKENQQLSMILRIAEPTSLFIQQAKGMKHSIFLVYLIMYGLITLFLLRIILKRNQPIQTILPILRKMTKQPNQTELILTDSKYGSELYQLINQLNETLRDTYQAYTDTEEQFQALLKELTIGIFMIQADGNLRLMNHAMCEQLGLVPPIKENQAFAKVINDPQLIQMIYQVHQTQGFIHQEITTAQTKRRLDISVRFFTEDHQILGVSYDLTKIRHLETMQKDFVSNVSHELKTPVTSLIGFTETLLDGAKDDPELTEQFLQIMQKDALRLQALIQEIIQLSKTNELFAYESQEVDLSLLCQQILTNYQESIQNKHLQIDFVAQSNLKVLTKKELLQPICKNLIENAIQYAPLNSQIQIQWCLQENHYQFIVKDNGLGIDPKEHERIFERFYRVDKARARHSGGTGLGLAIVKDYTEKLGGTVAIKSQLGKGATFIITIPYLKR